MPYYQPIIPLGDTLQGVEVLVRWKLSNGSLLLPVYFIDVAEKMEVINQITLTLVKKVQKDFSQNRYQYERKVFCAFNLTAQQIENKAFIDQLIDQLIDMLKSETNFIASFEITERQHFKNLAMAKANIRSLQEQGYQIKLDDAGTGYGGFSYFMDFNLDGVKIDKMFIDVIGGDDVKVEVLNSIIMMAKRLGIDIVAEGVETQQQVDFLRAHKIDYIQGYYYSKPVPFNDLDFND
ncbi:EAL domain-containing protein [Photobacterium angustum]|nr:EAL domain-containing protein [Photobacterium angustum]PSV94832.1 EAL domain-containing protein [Photobacterium angustum]PSW78789.1 EAL domain-containing protein [Photobacterium angustum]